MACVSRRPAFVGDEDLAINKRPVASASRAVSLGTGRLASNGGDASGREQVNLLIHAPQEQVKKYRDWSSVWRARVMLVLSM